MNYNENFKDCYVSLDGDKLTIGNDRIERTFMLNDKRPLAVSMLNKKTGTEWYTTVRNSEGIDGNYAFHKKSITEGVMKVLGIEASTDDDLGIAEKHLRVVVKLEFDNFYVDWIHLVYPNLPMMRTALTAKAKENAVIAEEEEEQQHRRQRRIDDFTDFYPLAAKHSRWKLSSFYDRTDDNDNLVTSINGITTPRETRDLQGNILQVQDSMSKEGVLFVKEGPTPFAYLGGMTADFCVRGLNMYSLGWGFTPEECMSVDSLGTYGSAVMLWEKSEEDAYLQLHKYQRALRRFVPERDSQIMANTWGDGNADGRLCEEFIMNELKRAKEIGIDFYQIDDGWQRGTTGNSVNAKKIKNAAWGQGYYKSDPEFWTVNLERFPNGLEPIVKYANENGIRLGLWFSPDSSNNFANWEKDSTNLLNIHKKYGIKAFKMDGVGLRNKIGEENYGKLVRRVIENTNGVMLFNLDTTAGTRNGLFGRVQYGSIFLENRFTNNFGSFPNYWPHLSLRNLWMLSRYIPTERLQIEFLNPYRNEHLYGDDPLSPANCGMNYVFAASMFANPLAWMELTALNEKAVAELHSVVPTYRKIQADILEGYVQPIGNEPDGTQWTGFRSEKEDGSGYLLIIREINEADSFSYKLNGAENAVIKLESIFGDGKQTEIKTDANGSAIFELDKPHSYALYRYTIEK